MSDPAPPAGAERRAGARSELSASGARVVAIGGGHGLAKSLGAIRRYASALAAIVSVADDGGSSGRLRDAFGVPAPGDVRKCLGAMLPGSSPLGRALEHRFEGGELDGHAFGNLLVVALAATAGDFAGGVAEACRILGTVGEVFPATTVPVVLKAEAAGSELEGQVKIMATTGVSRVSLVPPDAAPPPGALEAISAADQVVIGPGSLYTSVLAALVPAGIAEALATSGARIVYVCNLREQVPETAGYDVAAHLDALLAHGVVPDVVLADTAMAPGEPHLGVEVVRADLARPGGAVHDEAALAEALAALV